VFVEIVVLTREHRRTAIPSASIDEELVLEDEEMRSRVSRSATLKRCACFHSFVSSLARMMIEDVG